MAGSKNTHRYGASFLMLLSALLSLLAACGQISLKQGGGADDLKAAEAQCRAQSHDPDAYKACMNAKGWTTMDDFRVEADTSRTAPSMAPTLSTPPVPGASGDTASGNTAAAPDGMVKIASWWKMGGSPEDLNNALKACATSSDNDAGSARVVTRAVLACMKHYGWRAITQK